jgi:ParB family chromosome partitioning protein
VRRIEDHLRRHFQTDVSVHLADRARGEIRIAFYSAEDFDRVLDVLGTRPE